MKFLPLITDMLNYTIVKFHVPRSYSMAVIKPCHDCDNPKQYTDKQVWWIYTWSKQTETQQNSFSYYDSTLC